MFHSKQPPIVCYLWKLPPPPCAAHTGNIFQQIIRSLAFSARFKPSRSHSQIPHCFARFWRKPFVHPFAYFGLFVHVLMLSARLRGMWCWNAVNFNGGGRPSVTCCRDMQRYVSVPTWTFGFVSSWLLVEFLEHNLPNQYPAYALKNSWLKILALHWLCKCKTPPTYPRVPLPANTPWWCMKFSLPALRGAFLYAQPNNVKKLRCSRCLRGRGFH